MALHVNDTFRSFEEFQEKLLQHQTLTFTQFTLRNSEKLPESDVLAAKLRYSGLRYTCKYGKAVHKSVAQERLHQKTYKVDCPVQMNVRLNRPKGQDAVLRITKMVTEHANHEVSNKSKMEKIPKSQSAKDLLFILEGFQDTIFDKLRTFWKTSRMCDLTLQMSEGALHVHSCLMAAYSPTIADMLSKLESYFNEKGKRSQRIVTIDVNDFSLRVMEAVVSSLYTGRLEVSSRNVKELLNAVRWLGIENLVFAIEQTMSQEEKQTIKEEAHKKDDFASSNNFNVVIGDGNIRSRFCEELVSPDVKPQLSHKNNNSTDPSVIVEMINLPRVLTPSNEREGLINGNDIPLTVCNVSKNNENEMTTSAFNNNEIDSIDNMDINLLNEKNLIDVEKETIEIENSGNYNETFGEECKVGKKRKLMLKVQGKPTFENWQSSKERAEIHNTSVRSDQSERSRSKKKRKQVSDGVKTDNVLDPSEVADDGSSTMRCQKCPCKFDDSEKYNDHVNNHPIFSCQECPEMFFTKDKLSRHHLSMHFESIHLICSECPFQASSSDELCSHSQKEHKQPKPFSCKYADCLYRSHRYHRLERHMDKTHKKDKVIDTNKAKKDDLEALKCQKCSYKFNDIEDYNHHVNNHPSFSCEDCQLIFYEKRRLTNHRYSVHLQNSFLVCNECSFQAKSTNDLCRHSIKEHNQPRPFKCNHSGCTFNSNKYNLIENHVNACHKEKDQQKQYSCRHCGKAFRLSQYVKRHMKSCLRLEEYLCDICGQSFNRRENLQYHKNSFHLRIRNYKCAQCSKTFYYRSRYRAHLVTHTNEYPYSCPDCSRVFFRSSSSLRKHRILAHGYKCEKSVNVNYKTIWTVKQSTQKL